MKTLLTTTMALGALMAVSISQPVGAVQSMGSGSSLQKEGQIILVRGERGDRGDDRISSRAHAGQEHPVGDAGNVATNHSDVKQDLSKSQVTRNAEDDALGAEGDFGLGDEMGAGCQVIDGVLNCSDTIN